MSPICRSATRYSGSATRAIEGAYAEKIAIKAAIIAKKPARLGHAEAAAMALTSLTALWALEDTAKLKAGETILIQGGAGGVAGFAIQLAKHLGATVITTASARNHDYVRHLGADRVIDYNKEISPRRFATATWCSTRSAAMSRSAPMRC